MPLAGCWGGDGQLQQAPGLLLADPFMLGQGLDAGVMLAPPEIPIEQDVPNHRVLFLHVTGRYWHKAAAAFRMGRERHLIGRVDPTMATEAAPAGSFVGGCYPPDEAEALGQVVIKGPLGVGIGQLTAGDFLSPAPESHAGGLVLRVGRFLKSLDNLGNQLLGAPSTGYAFADDLGDLIPESVVLALHEGGSGLGGSSDGQRVGRGELGTSAVHDGLEGCSSLTAVRYGLVQIGGKPPLPVLDLIWR